MPPLPRVAVGTVQQEADGKAILRALIEALREQGFQVQSFLSRACFPTSSSPVPSRPIRPIPGPVCRDCGGRGKADGAVQRVTPPLSSLLASPFSSSTRRVPVVGFNMVGLFGDTQRIDRLLLKSAVPAMIIGLLAELRRRVTVMP